MAQAGYLNINLEGSFCVAEFAFDKKRRSGVENDISDKEQSAEELFIKGQKVCKIIESQFRSFCGEKLLTLSQTGSILVLVPTRGKKQGRIKETVLRIVERVEKDCQEVLYVGIGDSKDYLTEVRDSRNEAAAAVRVAETSCLPSRGKKTNRVLCFKEIGVYTLISHVDNQKLLDQYVATYLGKLIQADKIHRGNLCGTLEHYLNCNCNAKQTAEEMFVHRNTMNYRLKKISEILECDLEELEECLELKLAFKILRYKE